MPEPRASVLDLTPLPGRAPGFREGCFSETAHLPSTRFPACPSTSSFLQRRVTAELPRHPSRGDSVPSKSEDLALMRESDVGGRSHARFSYNEHASPGAHAI